MDPGGYDVVAAARCAERDPIGRALARVVGGADQNLRGVQFVTHTTEIGRKTPCVLICPEQRPKTDRYNLAGAVA